MTNEIAEYCIKECLRERERERTKRNVSEIELRNVTGKEG